MILGASTSGLPETNLFTIHYTNNTFDTVTQAFSDWQYGYTGSLGSTAPGESIALNMSTYLSSTAVVSQHVDLYGYVFPVNPNNTVAYMQLPDDPSVVIVAIDEVYQPEQVNLGDATGSASPAFNAIGISTNAQTVVTGNLSTYSANALGNVVSWNGQIFDIGPATVGVNDEIMASGSPAIALPGGYYTSIQFLGSASGGGPISGPFYVDYAGGTSDTFNLSISSWTNGYTGTLGTTGPEESVAVTMTSYNTPSGDTPGNVDVYGYVLQTDPSKKVIDLRATNNNTIKILAIDVVNQPVQVNLGDATDNASPAFNAVGISVDNRTQVSGSVSTYSANALGNTVVWNSQTFNIGPATVSVDDEVEATGSPAILLPQGYYTSIQFLAMAESSQPSTATFYVDYTNGTSDTFTLGLSSWTTGYDGTKTTEPWESIASTMIYYNSSTGKQSSPAYLYGYVLPTNPGKTVMDLRASNNTTNRILAIDVVDQPPPVNLDNAIDNASPVDTVTALTTNYEANYGGSGLDGSGDVYSINALGGSSLTWNGQTFDFGPTSTANAVVAAGQTIALTPGYYTSIQLLGTATGGAPQSASVTVNYIGGGTSTFTQTFSDWMDGYTGAGTTAPGEAIAAFMTSYNTLSGTVTGAKVYLYGYTFAVNPSEQVASITLSSNSKVFVLAVDGVNAAPQVNLGNGANASPAANVYGLTFNGGASDDGGTGLDTSGDTYSLTALAAVTGSASVVTWNAEQFNLGPAYIDDAVSLASATTIPLPEGYFTSIQILGTAIGGTHQTMTFTVNYVTGSPSTFTQTFSDWHNGYSGAGTTAAGESIAVHMTSYDTPTGNLGGNAYLYGYVFSTSATQIISSIQFPTSSNIRILSIDEINAAEQTGTATGVFVNRDTTTEGSWIGLYGTQGYDVIGDTASIPSYATVTPSGQTTYTWAASTTDTRGLQNPGGSGRIAECWYSGSSFTVDVNLTDGLTHDLELYFVDWDATTRSENIKVSNAATGAVLDTETVSSFHSGIYLEWAVSGNILITLTKTGGSNAVLSGIFFDPAAAGMGDAIIESPPATRDRTVAGYGMATVEGTGPASSNAVATSKSVAMTAAPVFLSVKGRKQGRGQLITRAIT
jgi:hypothetical protein